MWMWYAWNLSCRHQQQRHRIVDGSAPRLLWQRCLPQTSETYSADAYTVQEVQCTIKGVLKQGDHSHTLTYLMYLDVLFSKIAHKMLGFACELQASLVKNWGRGRGFALWPHILSRPSWCEISSYSETKWIPPSMGWEVRINHHRI